MTPEEEMNFLKRFRKEFTKQPKSQQLIIGLLLIALFLMLASLAPDIGRRLGLLSRGKGGQQSFAAENPAQKVKHEKEARIAKKVEDIKFANETIGTTIKTLENEFKLSDTIEVPGDIPVPQASPASESSASAEASQSAKPATKLVKREKLDRDKANQELAKIAKQRKEDLKALLELDPNQAADLILSAETASTLANVPDAQAEQKVTLSGTYAVYHTDEFKNVPSQFHHYLFQGADKRLELFGTQLFPGSSWEGTVTVSGYQLDDKILATSITKGDKKVLGASVGPIKVAVIMANYAGGVNSIDASQVRAVYNGTPGADVASYFAEVSGGKASLVPAFFGPYTINSYSCGTGSDFTTGLKAANADITYSQYSRFVVLTNCANGGSATGSGPVSTPQGTVTAAQVIIGNDLRLSANIHEMSHTLGDFLSHGGYLSCIPQVFIPPISGNFGDQPCQEVEYADPYDVLGRGGIDGFSGHLSVPHKLGAGWLDSTQVTTVNTPNTTSTYTLLPYERNSGLVALKIPRGNTGSYFTVEYRQPIGFDSYINTSQCGNCNAAAGALIMTNIGGPGPGGGVDSNIIDNTPGQQSCSSCYWPSAGDGADGALLPGQTFTDPEFNITVKTISADSSGLTVQVTLASTSCTYAAPTVSAASPSSQTASPGQSKTYTFTVTNNNSAACAPDKFRFKSNSNSPSNNSDLLADDSLNLGASPDYFTLASGASTTVTLTVSSSTQTPDGSFSFGGYIYSRPFGISPVATPGVSYQVTSTADTAPPSAPSSPTAKVLGSSAISLSWPAASDNVGVEGYKVIRNSSAVFFVRDPSFMGFGLSPSTTYNYSVQAFDYKHNYSPAATISVTTPAKTDFTNPSVPTNLNATATDHGFNINWQASADNVGVAYYHVSPCAVKNSVLGNPCLLAGDQTSLTYNSSPSQTKWKIQIYAVDGDGNADPFNPSKPLTFKTAVQGDSAAPTKPLQLFSSPGAPSGLQLNWQASTDEKSIDHYIIYRGCCVLSSSTTNSYLDLAGQSNFYRVQAVDTDGSFSPESDEIIATGGVLPKPSPTPSLGSSPTVTPGPTPSPISSPLPSPLPTPVLSPSPSPGDLIPPSTPAGLTATASSSSQVNLSWTASTDNVGVVGYWIVRNGVTIASSTTNNYTDTTISANTTYNYQVMAFDAAGNNSTASNTATVATPNPPDTQVPSVPANLVGTAVSTSQINLSWDASADNVGVVAYDVFNGNTKLASVTTTSFGDTGLTASTTYSYNVVARDAAGNTSAASNTVSVTTLASPTPSPSPSPLPSSPGGLDTTPPAVNLTQPSNGAVVPVGKTIALKANASDNVKVSKVEFYVNGIRKCSDTSSLYSCNYKVPTTAGVSYTILAKVYDSSNLTATSSVMVTGGADTTAPTIPLFIPTNGSKVNVGSVVVIAAVANDEVGISKVEFYVNGSRKCSDNSSPYSCNWTVPTGANINYTLLARAYDAAGNKTDASGVVTSQ